MLWSLFITTMGLLLVCEGILPFLSPHSWRKMMQQMFVQTDKALRIMGLISMLLGLMLVCIARDLY